MQFGGESLDDIEKDCYEGLKQIDNIIDIRADIVKGLDYNIEKFNQIFNKTKHPIIITNIDLGTICCIIFNIVFLIIIQQSNRKFHEYHKISLYSFYAISMLYILYKDKTLNSIMNNIQVCQFTPWLIAVRTLIYIYLTVINDYQITAEDITENKKPYDVERNPPRGKYMFLSAKLLACSVDIITIVLFIFFCRVF